MIFSMKVYSSLVPNLSHSLLAASVLGVWFHFQHPSSERVTHSQAPAQHTVYYTGNEASKCEHMGWSPDITGLHHIQVVN